MKQGGDWWHGELGSISSSDVLVAISHSGTTAEIVGKMVVPIAREISFIHIVSAITS